MPSACLQRLMFGVLRAAARQHRQQDLQLLQIKQDSTGKVRSGTIAALEELPLTKSMVIIGLSLGLL